MNSENYIWQHSDWPNWTFDSRILADSLAKANMERGRLLGSMQALGFDLASHATLEILTEEVVKTSAIEGETLDPTSVRSSIARRLGIELQNISASNRNIDGVVEMVLDASRHYTQPLTAERLFSWQAALFPTGRSGTRVIDVGMWRTDAMGPMQVISGHYGREKVHYEAPPAARLPAETALFIEWFERPAAIDPIIKAGIAHLWFETLHPFEDGNGRVGRAVCDMALTRADGSPDRFYSLSTQIERERKDYYRQLEGAQKGGLNITGWLEWFIACVCRAVLRGHELLENVVFKTDCWRRWANLPLNKRQIQMLNMFIENFEGNLTAAKWASIAHCSADTALRDIKELIEFNVLESAGAGGRSTHYLLRQHE